MPAYYLDPALMGGGVSLPTYTGSMQIVKVANGKYYAILKTSGTLRFPFGMMLDVFLVGGGGAGSRGARASFSGGDFHYGGSGGGGGYVNNVYGITASASENVIIGDGGLGETTGGGGVTRFGVYSVSGGSPGIRASRPVLASGGNGGSGGGPGGFWRSEFSAAPGNGGSGGGGAGASQSGGIGNNGVVNTGGGGGGGGEDTGIGGSGGSGVVIIRWPSQKWK